MAPKIKLTQISTIFLNTANTLSADARLSYGTTRFSMAIRSGTCIEADRRNPQTATMTKIDPAVPLDISRQLAVAMKAVPTSSRLPPVLDAIRFDDQAPTIPLEVSSR
jgi:hypothetical protein